MAISGRHCRSERAIVKRHAPPICHCEERSDVAISGRHPRSVPAAVKTVLAPRLVIARRPEADVAISGRHCRPVRTTVKNGNRPNNSTNPQKGSQDMKQYYVYLLTNKGNTVLYTGMTNDLQRRLYEHREGPVESFTKQYHVHKLVYFETTPDVRTAIEREKQIKGWSRKRKDALVATMNPKWVDLSAEWEM